LAELRFFFRPLAARNAGRAAPLRTDDMPDSTPPNPTPSDPTESRPREDAGHPDTADPSTPSAAASPANASTQSAGPDSGPPAEPTVTGPGRLGDYELLAELGQGGMGKVFKARQVSVGREVAVKLLLTGPWASPAEVRRFLQEARALGNLDHPNIVPVYDRGEHDGRHWFSMKYVEGGSLARRAREFRSDPRRAAEFVAAAARAVAHAHARGILHRDLKPGNILVDRDGQPLVTDFGLAKWVQESESLTPTGAVIGTPGYMAPEQLLGGTAVTAAADVYGLGAVLYHLLTGRAPFSGDTPFETMRQVQEKKPEPPMAVNPAVPAGLERICMRCLEKDPPARYPSAQAVADALEVWLRQSGETQPAGQLVEPTGGSDLSARAFSLCVHTAAAASAVAGLSWLNSQPVFNRVIPESTLVRRAWLPLLFLLTYSVFWCIRRLFARMPSLRSRADAPKSAPGPPAAGKRRWWRVIETSSVLATGVVLGFYLRPPERQPIGTPHPSVSGTAVETTDLAAATRQRAAREWATLERMLLPASDDSYRAAALRLKTLDGELKEPLQRRFVEAFREKALKDRNPQEALRLLDEILSLLDDGRIAEAVRATRLELERAAKDAGQGPTSVRDGGSSPALTSSGPAHDATPGVVYRYAPPDVALAVLRKESLKGSLVVVLDGSASMGINTPLYNRHTPCKYHAATAALRRALEALPDGFMLTVLRFGRSGGGGETQIEKVVGPVLYQRDDSHLREMLEDLDVFEPKEGGNSPVVRSMVQALEQHLKRTDEVKALLVLTDGQDNEFSGDVPHYLTAKFLDSGVAVRIVLIVVNAEDRAELPKARKQFECIKEFSPAGELLVLNAPGLTERTTKKLQQLVEVALTPRVELLRRGRIVQINSREDLNVSSGIGSLVWGGADGRLQADTYDIRTYGLRRKLRLNEGDRILLGLWQGRSRSLELGRLILADEIQHRLPPQRRVEVGRWVAAVLWNHYEHGGVLRQILSLERRPDASESVIEQVQPAYCWIEVDARSGERPPGRLEIRRDYGFPAPAFSITRTNWPRDTAPRLQLWRRNALPGGEAYQLDLAAGAIPDRVKIGGREVTLQRSTEKNRAVATGPSGPRERRDCLVLSVISPKGHRILALPEGDVFTGGEEHQYDESGAEEHYKATFWGDDLRSVSVRLVDLEDFKRGVDPIVLSLEPPTTDDLRCVHPVMIDPSQRLPAAAPDKRE
jgi:serine/threonine protein kinase